MPFLRLREVVDAVAGIVQQRQQRQNLALPRFKAPRLYRRLGQFLVAKIEEDARLLVRGRHGKLRGRPGPDEEHRLRLADVGGSGHDVRQGGKWKQV